MASAMSTLRSNQSELTAHSACYYTTKTRLGKSATARHAARNAAPSIWAVEASAYLVTIACRNPIIITRAIFPRVRAARRTPQASRANLPERPLP